MSSFGALPAQAGNPGQVDGITSILIAAVFSILFVVWFVGVIMSIGYKIRDANISRHSTRYDAGRTGQPA